MRQNISPVSWLSVDLVLDDADLQAPAAAGRPAGQVAAVAAIRQEPADQRQRDIALDAD
jgi:hypothetical protein